jgi:hypothetical protein
VFGAWGAQRHILAYTSACETLLGKHTEEDTALGTEIHVLDLDQAQPRSTILYTGDAVTGLAWSGNDAWLAFSTRDTAHKPNGLWVMNAAGGSLQQIAARGAGPAWRPEVAASLPGAGRPGPPSVADLLILSLTLSIGGYLLRRTSKIRRHQK